MAVSKGVVRSWEELESEPPEQNTRAGSLFAAMPVAGLCGLETLSQCVLPPATIP